MTGRIAAMALLSAVLQAGGREAWVPARWDGDERGLDVLAKTPINCLLVSWNASRSAALAAFARAAHRRGMAVLGVPEGGADSARAAAEAGLDGLVGGDGPLLAGDALPPRVRDIAMATPTSEPWIDFNAWRVRSLRASFPGRPVWLDYPLQDPSPADYMRAIADAAVAGGRWVVALDGALRDGLRRGEANAAATLSRIAECLRFYEEHADWRSFAPAASAGIVQEGAPPEVVKLIHRRRVPYRILARRDLAPTALAGLRVLVAVDLAPTPGERETLAAFTGRGGQLVLEAPDAEALARDLWERIGPENLPVRLFNVSSVLVHLAAPPAGNALLVQLVNYAGLPAERITVRAAADYRRARLFRPAAPPLELKLNRNEVRIESIPVCAALLLEK